MVEAEIGVEAGAVEQGLELAADDVVAEGKHGVDRVFGRPAGASGKFPRGFEHAAKELEVGGSGAAFVSAQGVEVVGVLGALVQIFEGGKLGVGENFRMVPAMLAERGQGVADFVEDDGFGHVEHEFLVAMFFELGNAQGDVFRCSRGELAEQLAGKAEERKLNAMLEKLLQGLRGHLNVAKEHDVVNVVAGQLEEDVGLVVAFRGRARAGRFARQHETVAGFAQHGVLVDEVEDGHMCIQVRSGK